MIRQGFVVVALGMLMACLLGAVPTRPPGAPGGKITLTGKLQTGVMAPGGETTGVVLMVDTQGTFELDIQDAALRKQADGLSGKQVIVTGTLTIRQGVAVAQRRIITVDTLQEVPPPKTRP